MAAAGFAPTSRSRPHMPSALRTWAVTGAALGAVSLADALLEGGGAASAVALLATLVPCAAIAVSGRWLLGASLATSASFIPVVIDGSTETVAVMGLLTLCVL